MDPNLTPDMTTDDRAAAMRAALAAEFPTTYDEGEHLAALAAAATDRAAQLDQRRTAATEHAQRVAAQNATYYAWQPIRSRAALTPGTEAHHRTEVHKASRSAALAALAHRAAERLAAHEHANTAPAPATYSTPRTVARWHAATRPGNVPAADALALALETIGIRPKGTRATLRDEAQHAHAEHAQHAADEHDTVPGSQDAPTVGTGHKVRLKWNDRREVTYPARYTRTDGPALVAPGEHPRPISHDDAAAFPPDDVLAAGSGIWLTASTGTVAHRTATDIDGKPIGTGGKARTSTRPSTVPKSATKTKNPVQTATGQRQRLWTWLDKFGQVQARTMSGHDVRLTPRNAAAIRRTLTPAAERAATI